MKNNYQQPECETMSLSTEKFMAASPFNSDSHWLDGGKDYSDLFGEDN